MLTPNLYSSALNDAVLRNAPLSEIEEEEKKLQTWDQKITVEDIESTKQVTSAA